MTKKLNQTKARRQLTRDAKNWRVWEFDDKMVMQAAASDSYIYDKYILPWVEAYKAVRPHESYRVELEMLEPTMKHSLRIQAKMVRIAV